MGKRITSNRLADLDFKPRAYRLAGCHTRQPIALRLFICRSSQIPNDQSWPKEFIEGCVV